MATNPYSSVTISNYNDGPPPDDGTTGSNNQILWSGIKSELGDPVKTALESVNTNVSNAFATSPIQLVSVLLDAGSSSVPPLRFQSGTNLTTPLAGAFEYDGQVLYSSFAASQRGVSPSIQYVCNSGDKTLNSDANAQSPFVATADTLTVTAATTYLFDSFIYLTTGTTTHTTAFGFGGTATITSVLYYANLVSSAAATIATSASWLEVVSAAATVLNATSGAASTKIRLKGTIRINVAGTLIPQITFSANPGGTNLGKTNSFFRLYPVGINTVTSVGNWS